MNSINSNESFDDKNINENLYTSLKQSYDSNNLNTHNNIQDISEFEKLINSSTDKNSFIDKQITSTKKGNESYFSLQSKPQSTICNLYNTWPFFLAFTIHSISLTGCILTEQECNLKFPPHLIIYFGIILYFMTYLYIYQIELALNGSCNKLIIPFQLFWFYRIINYDKGFNFKHHGGYNTILIILSIVIMVIYKLLKKFYFYKKEYNSIKLIVVLAFFLFYLFKNYSHLKDSCNSWEYGFGNSKINNTNSGCIISKPKFCMTNFTEGIFDFNKLYGISSCEKNYLNKKEPLLKSINLVGLKYSNLRTEIFNHIVEENKILQNNLNVTVNDIEIRNHYLYLKEMNNLKALGFPRTEDLRFNMSCKARLHNYIFENMIDMNSEYENMTELKNSTEAILYLDEDDNKNRIEINLRFNKSASEDKKNIYESLDKIQKDGILSNNTLIFFVDSLTRVSFKRKLPKLFKWIENKYHGFNNKSEKYEAFQFFKFHGLGKITTYNMFPIVHGIFYDSSNLSNDTIRLNRFFSEKGYITGQSLNSCEPDYFSIFCSYIANKVDFYRFDHELYSIFCDPNYSFAPGMTKKLGEEMIKGLNSVFLRCLYKKHIDSYSIDYTLQFFDKYKSNKKFFSLGFYDAHESTQESIKHSDDLYVDFFDQMDKKGHLDNTIVYIISDHGLSIPSQNNIIASEDWIYEHLLPNLMLLVPTNIKDYDKIKENLIYNENSLINPFNIRHSLLGNIGIENEEDIFSNKISKNRQCDFPFKYDSRDFCRCIK